MQAYIPDSDSRKQAVTEFFAKSGQQFLPVLELLLDARQQLHDFAHGVGVAAIEGLLGHATGRGTASGQGRGRSRRGLRAGRCPPPWPSTRCGGHG